ncbi:MAG: hypothetical protein ACRDWT_01630 [Jatrophihabitantaceae bacterium]
MAVTVADALADWGGHDRDDPFGLYAAVRAGPVHPVTLADGRQAWLAASYDEARSALKDTRLSKDMHAAFALDGSSRSWRPQTARCPSRSSPRARRAPER